MPDDESAVPKELVPGAAALEPKAPPVTDMCDPMPPPPPGKRGGGRKADAKGDAKSGKLFHTETPSTRDLRDG
jgi:hypothetical protein